MYGDVFGNRDPEVFGQDLGRESESRTPTETPTHVHRWQPVFEQERLTARYGAFLSYAKQGLKCSSVSISSSACTTQFGLDTATDRQLAWTQLG